MEFGSGTFHIFLTLPGSNRHYLEYCLLWRKKNKLKQLEERNPQGKMRTNHKFNPLVSDPRSRMHMVVSHLSARSGLDTTILGTKKTCHILTKQKHMVQNTLKYSVILLLASERPLLLSIPSKQNQLHISNSNR